jgi:hypothetical protein
MMTERYYSETLLRGLAYEDDVNGNCDGMIDFTVIDSISGADVEPVRHGEWIPIRTLEGAIEVKCTNCESNCIFGKVKINYCPNCGARMNGGNR